MQRGERISFNTVIEEEGVRGNILYVDGTERKILQRTIAEA